MGKKLPTQPLSEEVLVERLKNQGILPTQQRLQIAAVLFARHRHLSAEQVLTEVQAAGHRVSKATVYNTLGLFAREGLIREVIVDPNRVFYDPNNAPHHHFYNLDTGELIDVDTAQFPIERLPELPAGTVAAGVDVIIRVRQQ